MLEMIISAGKSNEHIVEIRKQKFIEPNHQREKSMK